MAQFGVVQSLGSTMGTGQSTLKVTLDPTYGSLQKVTAASTVTAVDAVDSFGNAADAILTPIEARRAEKASNTQLNRLNEENALLEAEIKNQQLRKEAGLE